MPRRRRVRAGLLRSLVPLLALACRDVTPNVKAPRLEAPGAVEARLVLSTADPRPGDELVALVQVRTGADVGAVGSFTARVTYDPERLRLEGEHALGGQAMRVLNPARGQARVAGIATGGFTDGRLVALRFTALGAGATQGLRLAFDELHAVDREDLRRVAPAAAIVDPQLSR